jgi:hypothetical protein
MNPTGIARMTQRKMRKTPFDVRETVKIHVIVMHQRTMQKICVHVRTLTPEHVTWKLIVQYRQSEMIRIVMFRRKEMFVFGDQILVSGRGL